MSIHDPKETCEFSTVSNDIEFQKYLTRNPSGILLVPQPYFESKTPVISGDAGDFAKWLKRNAPKMDVQAPKNVPRLMRRAGDYWVPLVFLASDITLPIYLNLVSSYIYDRMKGALKGETARVHLSAVYRNKHTGVTKRFDFDGDVETLQKTVKKFDANQFFDE